MTTGEDSRHPTRGNGSGFWGGKGKFLGGTEQRREEKGGGEDHAPSPMKAGVQGGGRIRQGKVVNGGVVNGKGR